MGVPSLEQLCKTEADNYPLLMGRLESSSDSEHIVDVTTSNDASPSFDDGRPIGIEPSQHEARPSNSTEASSRQSSLSSSSPMNSRNSSLIRRNEGYAPRRRSPLNSKLWISVELVVTVSQIIASIVVLLLSRHENPQAPLFAWVVGYASGCVATLPILYWRYRNRSRGSEHESSQLPQGSSQGNLSAETSSYAPVSVIQASELPHQQPSRISEILHSLSLRLNGLVDHFKIGLDCFFAVWFVVGNVWIFGGHSSPSDAPILYRLCIVFLTFSCIGYAMPFILCATICCCLPCIVSILGFREDFSQTRGATPRSIDALPTYKFKLKKNADDLEINLGAGEGGILAAGTEKERVVSGEDAVCCICLSKYSDNDELKVLPCSHFFHVDCVDKWLKINASCPLCKIEVGERVVAANSSQHQSERRLGIGPAEGGIYGGTVF